MSDAGADRKPEAADEPKVVVDEDWKSRVQAEKEAAQAARAAKASSGEPAPAEEQARETPQSEVPDASFEVLVNSLAVQAMAALGALPDPAEGHAVVRPDSAKHYIDTLAMLEAKTRGNLAAEESRLLETALHQLRMLFISVRKPDAGDQQKVE